MDEPDVTPDTATAQRPYRFIPAGPGRPIRPAQILRGEDAKKPVTLKVTWHGPKAIPPDALRLLVEMELGLTGPLPDEGGGDVQT